MENNELTLREFITTSLAADASDAADDNDVFRAVNAVAFLQEGESNEADQSRTVTISEDSDGRVTAKSIKLYNIVTISFHDLSGFFLKGLFISFAETTKQKIVFGLLALVHEFYPKLSHAFNEQDSRVLLVMLELGNREFTLDEVAHAHRQRFGEELPRERLNRTRDGLEKYKILRYKGAGKYIVREKMTYERSW